MSNMTQDTSYKNGEAPPGASPQLFDGEYSDGTSAKSYPVQVWLAEDGVKFRFLTPPDDQHLGEAASASSHIPLNHAETIHWSYEQLSSAHGLRPKHGAQLGIRENTNIRLYIDDSKFTALLINQTPALGHSYRNKRANIWVFSLAAVMTTLLLFFWFSQFSLAAFVAKQIPETSRKAVGRQFAQHFTKEAKSCTNPAGIAVLNKLMDRLLSQRQEIRAQFEIRVVRLPIVNAFALPGDLIIVSESLIKQARSAEEVAGVVAHEIGHGIADHSEIAVIRALGLSAAVSLMLGGSTSGLTDIGTLLLQLRYSRNAETEADTIGLELLKESEIAPKGLAEFLRRAGSRKNFAKKDKTDKKQKTGQSSDKNSNKNTERKSARRTDFLSTHPNVMKRAQQIESLPKWQSRPALTAAEWKSLRNICGGKTKKTPKATPKTPGKIDEQKI